MDVEGESTIYETPDCAENLHAAADIELSQIVPNECYGVIESKQKVDECAVNYSAAKVSENDVKSSSNKLGLICCTLIFIIMVIAVATTLACLPVIFINISELNSEFTSLQQTEIAALQNETTRQMALITSFKQSLNSVLQDNSRLRSEIAVLQENVSTNCETTRQTLTTSFNQSLVDVFQDVSELKLEIAVLQENVSTNCEMTRQTLTTSFNQSLVDVFQDVSELKLEIAVLQENVSTNCEMTRQTLTTSLNRSLVAIWQVISQSRSGFSTLGQCSDVLENFGGVFIPAASCAAVLELVPSSPSGYYLIMSSNGSAVCVYCDMTRSCGGVTGGWMRVAELDMTNSSSQCPSGLTERNDSNISTCGIASSGANCSSVTLPTGITYSKVCGRIIAYQYGTTDAFATSIAGRDSNADINTPYVDGVSLTHGIPRQHIWTFAAAHDETANKAHRNCPCANVEANIATPPPVFVGNDYFCDTGSQNAAQSGVLYSQDPLWDGAGCGPDYACCSFNCPPWFYKQLSALVINDMEMRVCRDEARDNEDVVIEAYDIYIQ